MASKSAYAFQPDNFLYAKENMKGLVRERMTGWRSSESVVRLERPTNIARARSLGYKAKAGFVVVRVRVPRGGLHKKKIKGGRRPRRYGYNKLTHGKSDRWVAEERAQKKFPNLQELSSYYIAEDGKHKFYEVILLDTSHPNIYKDKNLKWISGKAHRGRVFRGLTSAGKKARGLRGKGKGYEKSRPSIRANGRLRRH
ncbi:MAG: 50S ribosomal protein L15e [Thermoplasmatales archaeon]